ncbi:hypothetical protein TI39_contig311g00023 [Zymoseptoria brevis]|uniref:Uncharacterized protein n=1 Tax=Zymoseptoria brevis TaxID=1047168 RepID=A0A0F4GUB5_9PEZI|nr:hypothetical protein TI39_contig311g00023 [Zymoseptoria brevis]
MSAFASVYRAPALAQQSYLARELKRVKRKREASSDEGSRHPSHESIPSDHDEDEAPRVLHPVNKKDPCYVAGHARDQPLPPGDFPHAAVKDPKPDRSVEEELAQLNPPIYIPKVALKAESLRRRHLDNLTAILHKCMLNADWKRASRTWGLILRTEFSGRGTDVRQHGRWMIGAEILMRRDETVERIPLGGDDDEDSAHTQLETVLSDEGFKLARDYYERLILQYPHLQRTHHSTINALAIYPAMFSIWIYEVQNRSSRARQKLQSPSAVEISEMDINTSMLNDRSTEQRRSVYEIRNRELEQATPIAQRLDELLVNPPYDTSHELLHARGMVALWLSDLHKELTSAKNANMTSSRSDDGDLDASLEDVESSASAVKVRSERQRARKIFQRLRGAGSELPQDIVEFLEDDEEDQNDE